jgi:O-antigen ligase
LITKKGLSSLVSQNYDFEKAINIIIVIYAFLVPISRAGIVFFSALLILLWFFNNLKAKVELIKSSTVIKVFILFIIYNIVSLLWSENLIAGLDYIRKYWYFLPMLVIFTSLKQEYIERAIIAFLMGMLISEILSYGIFFELWTLRHGSPDDPTPFMNHLQYSMFLTFTSLLLLNRVFFTQDIKLKLFYFIYFLFVTSNLFLNGGRTGHFAFAVSIFVVGFLNIKNKFVAFFSMLFLVVAIFYTAYQVSPVFQKRFDASTKEVSVIKDDESSSSSKYCGSFGARLGALIVGWDISKDNIFLGTGVGDAMSTLDEYLQEEKHKDKKCLYNAVVKTNFHNYYMQTLVQLGIIGLFLYLFFFYAVYKLDIKNKKYYNLMVIFLSVYSVSSLVENMFHQQFSMAIASLFIGMLLAISRIEKNV